MQRLKFPYLKPEVGQNKDLHAYSIFLIFACHIHSTEFFPQHSSCIKGWVGHERWIRLNWWPGEYCFTLAWPSQLTGCYLSWLGVTSVDLALNTDNQESTVLAHSIPEYAPSSITPISFTDLRMTHKKLKKKYLHQKNKYFLFKVFQI